MVSMFLISALLLIFTSFSCDHNGCDIDRERQLNIDDPDVKIKAVAMDHRMYLYTETKQFFIFGNEKVVLTIYFDNTAHPFPIDASFHIFNKNEKIEKIDGWVNNQHSDAIAIDAAEPIREEPLPVELITITSEIIAGQSEGTFGDLYDHYKVAYTVSEYTVDDLLSLSGFNHDASVYFKK
jgi:hypothetical protein